MIKKVLIAEDIDSINMGVISALSQDYSFEIEHAKYCDNALLKVKKALQDGSPFDLLITDLSFANDYVNSTITSGAVLIAKVKNFHPQIKTIIYSIEDRPYKIREFMEFLEVDAYVLKGRNSTRELIEAIMSVAENKQYISPELAYSLKNLPALEIDDYDLELIMLLANGNSQQEISVLFDKKGMHPTSLSSIEKRINKLKDYFMAKNTPHLVAIAKDMGLF